MSEPQVTESKATESNPGMHRFYLEAEAGPNSIKEMTPYEDLKGDYFRLSVRLGYEPWLVFTDDIRFRGKFLVDLGYSFVGGDEGNLGSHRHMGELNVGWKQHIFSYFYLQPKFGIGVARNALNFGEGFPLDETHSFNLLPQLVGGFEFCDGVGKSCGSVFGGYFWDIAVVSPTPYLNQGGMGGLRFSFDPFLPEPPPPRVIVKYVDRPVEPPVKTEPKLELPAEKPKPEPLPPAEPKPPPNPEPAEPNKKPSYSTVAMVFFFTDNDAAIPLSRDATAGAIRVVNLQLERLAEYMAANPDKRFVLHGYANQTGAETRNRVLSLERVMAVRNYLIKKGKIAEDRLSFDGQFIVGRRDASGVSVHGSSEPRCEKLDPKHTNNRCVVIEEIAP